MDPQVETLLQRVKDSGRRPFWQGTPEAARSGPSLMKLLFGDAPTIPHVRDLEFPSADGTLIGARLCMTSEAPAGLIVFFHGGGWVLGSVADYHPFCVTLALRTGFAVLSVEYRLSPEYPFPVPIEDAWAALDLALHKGTTFLDEAPRVVIAMGDSAGATIATVACNRLARSGSKRQVDFQVLAYPVTNADFETPSYHDFAQGYLLTRNDMKWFWDQYCPNADLRQDPDASPLQSKALVGMPPTLILTAGCDPLRDEGEAYGQRLLDARVPTEVIRCEGLVHGFLSMINYAPSAGRAFEHIVAGIAKAGVRKPPCTEADGAPAPR